MSNDFYCDEVLSGRTTVNKIIETIKRREEET